MVGLDKGFQKNALVLDVSKIVAKKDSKVYYKVTFAIPGKHFGWSLHESFIKEDVYHELVNRYTDSDGKPFGCDCYMCTDKDDKNKYSILGII